jgi:hypothetical protein
VKVRGSVAKGTPPHPADNAISFCIFGVAREIVGSNDLHTRLIEFLTAFLFIAVENYLLFLLRLRFACYKY